MSERFQRSRVNLATSNTPRVRAAGPVAHQIPQFVGAMRGIDPRAGDMTAAFNNFFGTIGNAVQSTMSTLGKIEAQNIADQNEELKKLAAVKASEAFQQNAETAISSMPSQVQLQNGDFIDVSERKSFTRTYSHAIGTLTGQRMIDDFQTTIAQPGFDLNTFDDFSTQYFNQNFTGGTGNPFHDAAMVGQWNTKIDELRLQNNLELAKKAKEKLSEAVGTQVGNYAENSADITETNYLDSISQVKSAAPNLTEGQAASAVIGTWISVASKKATTAKSLSSFLTQPFYDDDGNQISQSLYEKFPREMEIQLQTLNKKYREHVTMGGTQVLTKHSSTLLDIQNMDTSTPANMKLKAERLAQLQFQSQELSHTEGVGGANISRFNTDLQKELNKHRTEMLSLRAASDIASGRKLVPGQPDLTNEQLEKEVPKLISLADFQNTKNMTDVNAFGTMVRNIHQQKNFIPKSAVNYLIEGLNNPDPNVQTLTVSAIKAFDPHNRIFASLLKDQPTAAAVYQGVIAGKRIDMSDPNMIEAMVTAPDDLSALMNGGVIPEKKRKETDITNFRNVVLGDGLTWTTDTLAEDLAGKGDPWFFGENLRLSTSLEKAVMDQAVILVANSRKAGKQMTLEGLRSELVTHFKGNIIVHPDNLVDFQRTSTKTVDGKEIPPLSNYTMNPSGTPESTVENVQEAVEDIENGLLGLTSASGVELDSSNLYVRPDPGVAKHNGLLIFEDSTKEPLRLGVGTTYKTERIYDEQGERFSGIRDFLPSFIAEGFENQDVKLTGDPAADAELVKSFLHPSIGLVPIRNLNGDVVAYNLAVVPYYKNIDEDYINSEEYQKLLKEEGPMVARRKYSEYQLKLMNPNTPGYLKILGAGY